VWLATATVLAVLPALLPGLTVSGPGPALAGAALLGLLNAFVWPVLAYLALPMLSDHGQSQGATFADRYGYSLGDLVRAAMDTDAVREVGAARVAGEESWGYVRAAMTDVVSPRHAVGRRLGRALRDRRGGDEDEPGAGHGDAVVLASGNLGLVYLTEEPGRMTMEMIEKRYSKLVPTLVNHPGVGFVLVRSERFGATVLGRDGMLVLDPRTVSGVDPLARLDADGRPSPPPPSRRDRSRSGRRTAPRTPRAHGPTRRVSPRWAAITIRSPLRACARASVHPHKAP
jgi:hypothetical protein